MQVGAASTQTGGMGMVIFDTLAAARDLEAAGIEPKHAEAIVSIQRKTAGELATKTDLDNAVSKLATKVELDSAVSRLATKADLSNAVSKLATKAELNNLATKTELAIANLATKVELAELRAEIKADMLKAAVGIVIANAALTAALVRLL